MVVRVSVVGMVGKCECGGVVVRGGERGVDRMGECSSEWWLAASPSPPFTVPFILSRPSL